MFSDEEGGCIYWVSNVEHSLRGHIDVMITLPGQVTSIDTAKLWPR